MASRRGASTRSPGPNPGPGPGRSFGRAGDPLLELHHPAAEPLGLRQQLRVDAGADRGEIEPERRRLRHVERAAAGELATEIGRLGEVFGGFVDVDLPGRTPPRPSGRARRRRGR